MILNRQQQQNLFAQVNAGGGGGGTTLNISGNIIADNDEQVETLISKINDAIEFGNADLRPEGAI